MKRKSEFRASFKRIIILFIFFVFYTLHTFINWLFSLLDEVFFLPYKKTEISNPVFITGAPRSGTTFMHRSLAEDRVTFTSFTLGEILFAPTVVQKYVLHSISWLDKRLKSPLRRSILWIEGKLTKRYSIIHKYSLLEPDEDEILLIDIFSSLYLLFLFPEVLMTRKYTQFDETLSVRERDLIMKYYVKNIRKHLYFYKSINRSSGIYLSKSPVYISKINSIYKTFPDCKIIYIERDPLEVLASWISMNSIVFKMFHSPVIDYPLKEETTDLLENWLHSASVKLSQKNPDSFYIVNYNQFVNNPGTTIRNIYSHFDLEVPGEYEGILNRINNRQKNYRSTHIYSLQEIGLDKISLGKRFTGF